MINVIDYVNLCSDVLLNSIDEIYEMSAESDKLFIDFSNKKIQDIFKFYLKSQLNSKHQYGYFNIVVLSCQPKNNWRSETDDNYMLYQLTDDSITVNYQDMDLFLGNCFKTELVDKNDRFAYIYRYDIDIYDYIYVLNQMFGDFKFNKNKLIIIENGNRVINHDDKIEGYIRHDIENILGPLGLSKTLK